MVCRICGSSDLVFTYSQGSNHQFKYYRCKKCRLINIDLGNVRIIENQHKYVEVFNPPRDYEKQKEAFKAYSFVAKHIPFKGTYLDIGCGSGSVLYFFKKNGWKVKGLELSSVFADHVKNKLQIEVEVSDFMVYNDGLNQYDLVSLRHVLEHIPDSIFVMTKISGLLKENGYGYFEFPNINGLSHRIQRLRNKIKFFQKKYSKSFVPGHCNEFSKYSFNYLLNQTGFKLIRWETYSNKPLTNLIYNRFHFGTKARVLVQKISTGN